jgi:predicted nucleic acid-binding protein
MHVTPCESKRCWCHERLGSGAWLIFLEDLLKRAYRIEAPTAVDLRRCHELQATYADLRIGVVDASIVALIERLDERKLATLDHRHFSVVRPASGRSLELLP